MEMMNENGYFKAVEDEYIKSLPAGSFSGTIFVVDHPGILDEVRDALNGILFLVLIQKPNHRLKKGVFTR